MSVEKNTSRRKKVAEPTAAPEAREVLVPIAKKKARAKKKAPAKKAPAKKATAIKAAAEKAAPKKQAPEKVEVAPPKPVRKAAPRKKKMEAPPAPVPTGLGLQMSLESRLQWQAGDACPEDLSAFVAPWLDADGGVLAETAHDFVAALIEKAKVLQHPLAIEPAVWALLALKRDAEGRVRRLEQVLTQGMEALASCPQYQLEAALFAVSAGRALLADDVGLGQREAAVAALHLWRHGFGLERLAVLAPPARHAAWRSRLPDGVRLVGDPAALEGQALDVLVVDVIEAWEVESLCRLACTHLHLLATAEPLRDERLAAWVEWLDDRRRGPLARLAELPAEAGTRERREALQTVVLSRHKREFADRLPTRLEVTQELGVDDPVREDSLSRLHAACARWQRLGFATEAERAEVLCALESMREAELDADLIQAQAEAVRRLAEEWAPMPLKVAAEPAKLAALAPLLADRPELLENEGAAAIVHLDHPWWAQALEARHAALGETRGLPVAWLLPGKGLSAALKRAPLATCLDRAPPWWPDAEWAALMDGLPALLDW